MPFFMRKDLIMNEKIKAKAVSAAFSFVAFILFTIVVKVFDVQPIGLNDTNIGCATINSAMQRLIGTNDFWYRYTEILGYFAIVCMFAFALVAFCMLVRKKSLKGVDYRLYALGVFYVIMLAFYVFFEKVIINYRPVLEDGELEASYPSSHTMLIICVMITAVHQFSYLLSKKTMRDAASAAACILAVSAPVGRLLAGVHWFTDIIGGILLSIALIALYHLMCTVIASRISKT